MVCKWQVEIDPFCQKVLAKHWPNVARYGDVRECGKHNLELVDLICGGFPCQGISWAGKGKGINGDERSWLWHEYHRIICEIRPRYIIVENVAAITNRGIDIVLGNLAKSRYDAEWICLPAAAFGAPHRRDRIFIVAYPNSNNVDKGMVFYKEHTKEIFSQGNKNRTELWAKTNAPTTGMVDGLPCKLDRDRLRALGNAIVPQVAEWIGQQIMRYEYDSD